MQKTMCVEHALLIELQLEHDWESSELKTVKTMGMFPGFIIALSYIIQLAVPFLLSKSLSSFSDQLFLMQFGLKSKYGHEIEYFCFILKVKVVLIQGIPLRGTVKDIGILCSCDLCKSIRVSICYLCFSFLLFVDTVSCLVLDIPLTR